MFKEITVTSQQQLDNLPHECYGRIYIKFGTPHDKAIVRQKYDFASVVAWGNSYGANWSDLAILECECEKSDVLVPLYGDGKARARKAKVLREVPLEECGLYGTIIAKRRANDE